MAAVDTGTTDTPHTCFTGLPRVFLWARTREIVECDGAFSSILTRLHLQRGAVGHSKFRPQTVLKRQSFNVLSYRNLEGRMGELPSLLAS